MSNAWKNVITMPVQGRSAKPRLTGVTMVIDKGTGLSRLEDVVQTAGQYIDIIKLTFGTSAFYEEDYLKKKNAFIASSNIDVMPGGTLFEVAIWQNSLDTYLKRTKALGFTAIEISDGTITLDRVTRKDAIHKALNFGFKVVTEAGKKDPKEALEASQIHDIVAEDLSSGAFKVIIEAREAGKGVGIFDAEGKVKDDEVDNIIAGVKDINSLIWEAPMKNQQQALLLRWGPNVNLGNIPFDEILALEALRQGMRGDTLKKVYLSNKEWSI